MKTISMAEFRAKELAEAYEKHAKKIEKQKDVVNKDSSKFTRILPKKKITND